MGEAMAFGVTCVATEVGESALVFGATGVVAQPSGNAVLARALITMLEKNRKRAATLADTRDSGQQHIANSTRWWSCPRLTGHSGGCSLSYAELA